jgi:hypothetical protein
MPGFLIVSGCLLALLGVLGFFSGPTSAQEAVGALIFLSGAVLFAAGAIVQAINNAHTTLALAATEINKRLHR